LRRELKASACPDDEISALFFDGRKDMTLVKEKIGSKWHSTKRLEDHYVLVGEPETLHLRHITVESTVQPNKASENFVHHR
jgi:hypothetical protein